MATTMVAFGQATCGAALDPVPVIDRASVFAPTNPLRVEFDHRGAEFKLPVGTENACISGESSDDEVVVHRVRFSPSSISSLKSRASPPAASRRGPYSTVQCVVAHLWRCITAARRLEGNAVTVARVAVDGSARLRHPPVPQEYIGNAVLWSPLVRTDDRYFRSLIDFASSGAVEEEGLVPTADAAKMVLSPDGEALGFPFRYIDFGSARIRGRDRGGSRVPCALIVRRWERLRLRQPLQA
ncbi:hypothetical protein EJB05_26699, partial [Eragrostis curvula]